MNTMPRSTSAIGPGTASGIAVALLALGLAGSVRAQVIDVDDASGHPGDTVEFQVRFAGGGSGASALRVTLGFDPATPIAARNGKPACAVNPDLMKESTTFGFLPSSCPPGAPCPCTLGADCTRVRAVVISFTENNQLPIADGVAFTCQFTIPPSAGAGAQFAIDLSSAAAVFPDGAENDISGASQGGVIRVVEAVPCLCDFDGDDDISLGDVQKAFNAFLNGPGCVVPLTRRAGPAH